MDQSSCSGLARCHLGHPSAVSQEQLLCPLSPGRNQPSPVGSSENDPTDHQNYCRGPAGSALLELCVAGAL